MKAADNNNNAHADIAFDTLVSSSPKLRLKIIKVSQEPSDNAIPKDAYSIHA